MPFVLSAVTLLTLLLVLSEPAAAGDERQSGPATPAVSATQPGAAANPLPAAVPTLPDVVTIHVAVTDQKRMPIEELKITDFRILEDGQSQTIKAFEEHSAAKNVRAVPLPPMPPGLYTNFFPAPESGPINILLVDKLNTPAGDQPYLQEQLAAFVRSALPGTQIAIFGLADRLLCLQGFAADPRLLVAALDLSGSGGAAKALAANVRAFQASQVSDSSQTRMRKTLVAMDMLARSLSSMPGRKNLIWVSGSFPLNPIPDGSSNGDPFLAAANAQDQFRETAHLLSRSQVAVYPVDTGMLRRASSADMSSSGSPATFTPAAPSFTEHQAESQAIMREMIRQTGSQTVGKAVGLGDAVAKAIALGSTYYTLSYSPTDAEQDGKLRKIEVSLDRPGAELSYRHGYFGYAADGKPQRKQLTTSSLAPPPVERDAIRNAMLRGTPEPTQILFKTYVVPAGAPVEEQPAEANTVPAEVNGPFQRFSVNYAAAPQDFFLKVLSPGHYEGHVEFVAIVYAASGAVVNTVDQSAHINLDAEGIKSIFRTGLQFHQIVSVPVTGAYVLRVGVHDLGVDRVGAVEIPIDAVKNLAVVAPPASKVEPPTLRDLPK